MTEDTLTQPTPEAGEQTENATVSRETVVSLMIPAALHGPPTCPLCGTGMMLAYTATLTPPDEGGTRGELTVYACPYHVIQPERTPLPDDLPVIGASGEPLPVAAALNLLKNEVYKTLNFDGLLLNAFAAPYPQGIPLITPPPSERYGLNRPYRHTVPIPDPFPVTAPLMSDEDTEELSRIIAARPETMSPFMRGLLEVFTTPDSDDCDVSEPNEGSATDAR